MHFFIPSLKVKVSNNSKKVRHEQPLKSRLDKKSKKFMLSTKTRLRIQNILNRIETDQSVTLEERIFLNKLSSISKVVSGWVTSSLGPEANSIDND